MEFFVGHNGELGDNDIGGVSSPDKTTSSILQASTQRIPQQGRQQNPITPHRRQRTGQERQELKQRRKACSKFLSKKLNFDEWEREKLAEYSYEELEEMQRRLFAVHAKEREGRAALAQGVANLGLEREAVETSGGMEVDEMEVDGGVRGLKCEVKEAGLDGNTSSVEENARTKDQTSDPGTTGELQGGFGGQFALPIRGATARPW